MALKTISELATELERAVPLLRSLIDLEAREAAARSKTAMVLTEQERAETRCSDTKIRTEKEVAVMRQQATERVAALEAEMGQKLKAARTEFDDWERTANATRTREAQLAASQQETLLAIQRQIAEAHDALHAVRTSLKAAREDFAKALAGVGA